MFDKKDKEIDFSSYLGKEVSEETKNLLRDFSKKHPNVRKELIEQTKNAMANTIFNDNQTRDYISGVKDALKYINRYL